MEWRRLILSELVAGGEVGLLGLDFPTSAVRAGLVKDGILTAGQPVESGTDVFMPVGGRREWRTLVSTKDGFLAHPTRYGAKATVVKECDGILYSLDRKALYRRVAKDLGCRHGEPEKHVPGVWSIGTKHLAKAGAAKVYIVERGVAKDVLERVVRAAHFKWIYVLGVGAPLLALDALSSQVDKVVVGGMLKANDERFFSAELEEMDSVVPPPQDGAFLDITSNPAVLVVGGVSISLPMDRGKPTAGVLLLSYLLENPYNVMPAWKLDGEVSSERRAHEDIAFGTDAEVDDKAVAAIRGDAQNAARELASLRRRSDASEVEIKAAENEVERLMEALSKTRAPGGRRRQLGSSSAELARQRVKNNLRPVLKEIARQNPAVAEQVKSALHQGYEVMFVPPPSWGM